MVISLETKNCFTLRAVGQEHCRDAKSRFFVPRKLFVLTDFVDKASQAFLVEQ